MAAKSNPDIRHFYYVGMDESDHGFFGWKIWKTVNVPDDSSKIFSLHSGEWKTADVNDTSAVKKQAARGKLVRFLYSQPAALRHTVTAAAGAVAGALAMSALRGSSKTS